MTGPRFILRLSVRTLGDEPVSGIDAGATIDVFSVRVTLKQRGPYLILQTGDFDSEAEAEAFLPKLKGGLWNIALEHHIAFTPYFERRIITRPPDPYVAARNLVDSVGTSVDKSLEPIHGFTEEEGYTIFRTDETIRFIAFGIPSLSSSTGWDRVARTLSAGIEQVRQRSVEVDGQLAIAMNLYLSSFYETSIRARFLTLMMVLEVLAPVTEKHPAAVQLLTDLQAVIDSQLAAGTDADARDALESLRRETDFRKETSIRRRVRRLVMERAPLDKADRETLARKVVAAYDLRGSVIHTGNVDQSELIAASDIALHTVKILLRELIGIEADPAPPDMA